MPPAKSTHGRPARQQQQQPTDRQTQSRTAAGHPATRASVRLPAALGTLPPKCAVLQHFNDAPGLQAMLLDDAASVRCAWECDMECRMASSERMIHEIHNMVPTLRLATLGAGSDVVPWTNPLTVAGVFNVAGNGNVASRDPVVHVLSDNTQEMVAACAFSALPLHSISLKG